MPVSKWARLDTAEKKHLNVRPQRRIFIKNHAGQSITIQKEITLISPKNTHKNAYVTSTLMGLPCQIIILFLNALAYRNSVIFSMGLPSQNKMGLLA